MPTASIGRWRFDYADDGPVDGPVVLMLHGFPQDHRSWDALSGALVAEGYRTIRPDQRGYSPGARPTDVGEYRTGPLVEDAIGLLDALDIAQAHVIGHDFGGMVAWGVATVHPERVLSLTILSTPHPRALSPSLRNPGQALKSWYISMFQIRGLAERVCTPGSWFWRGLMRSVPAEHAQRYADNARQPGALTAMLAWYRALPLEAKSSSVRWTKVTVPTLYLWGADDAYLGETAARATEQFVSGRYRFVPLAGRDHWLPETSVDVVLPELLAHLRGVPA